MSKGKEHFIWKAWNKAFVSRAKLTGSEWADLYRIIPAGTSSEPGPWRTDRVPYLKEPMNVATDHKSQIVILHCSSQIGKSELLLNVMSYYIDQEPCSQLYVQPTLDAVKSFSQQRLSPTLESSPRLSNLMPHALEKGRGMAKKTENTIRTKYFPGGFIAMEGANSPVGLASRPIRLLLADEIDRFPNTYEGDPLRLAMQRTTNFHNRKIVMASTPTLVGVSRIDHWYERSDKRVFEIPCPHCGYEEQWLWGMVRWDKNSEGDIDYSTVRLVCSHCGETIRGPGRPDTRLMERGSWRSTSNSGENGVVGFHLNSLYSPWVKLEDLVSEFSSAVHNRDKKGLQEFINLKLGEPFEGDSISEDVATTLFARREHYFDREILPEGVLALTSGCDVQRDRIEITVTGWGVGKEAWVISHNIIYGNPLEKAPWQQVDVLLGKIYNHEKYGKMVVSCTCIDSGDGVTADAVYAYCKQREANRIFAIKGRGGFDLPITSRPQRNNRFKAALFTLGVDAIKQVITQHLSLQEPGPAYVHIPVSCDEEYCSQLGAERLVTKYERGRPVQHWQKIRPRNEALDCLGYSYAALEILNVDLPSLFSLLNGQKPGQPIQKTQRKTFSAGVKL